MTQKVYANALQAPQLDLRHRIFSSETRWTISAEVDSDALSPDFISEISGKVLDSLLHQASERGVSLDWQTLQTRFHPRSTLAATNEILFIAEADVL